MPSFRQYVLNVTTTTTTYRVQGRSLKLAALDSNSYSHICISIWMCWCVDSNNMITVSHGGWLITEHVEGPGSQTPPLVATGASLLTPLSAQQCTLQKLAFICCVMTWPAQCTMGHQTCCPLDLISYYKFNYILSFSSFYKSSKIRTPESNGEEIHICYIFKSLISYLKC